MLPNVTQPIFLPEFCSHIYRAINFINNRIIFGLTCPQEEMFTNNLNLLAENIPGVPTK